MRVLRDRQDRACACAQLLPSSPTTQRYSLEDAGNLWAEWGIHGLILVSFGLQVFLFVAAGMRKRSTSRIWMSLLWLAYLSADSVAIFILGHLAVHASGPHHQLLFFWAPFVLLHLGGQHTITAFSMQDNELWRRHLLGLVTQVVVAAYVVSRTSWPDRRILAAMVLMFLAGCLRYAQRTLCLYNASPLKLKESALAVLIRYQRMHERRLEVDTTVEYNLIIDGMLNADGKRPPLHYDYMGTSLYASSLVSDTPVSVSDTAHVSPTCIQNQLQVLRSSADPCRAYNYVGTQLVLIYELLYTKAPLHHYFMEKLESLLERLVIGPCHNCVPDLFRSILCPFALSLFVVFPILSTTSAMVLFVVTEKSQLYSPADVIVSYILLIGAITLEVAPLFITFALGPEAPHAIQSGLWSVGKYIHPAWGTKQWSEMLGQYNLINGLTKHHATGINSFVPQWISKHLDDKTVQHIHIYEEIKKLVLNKLLEFGTRQYWDFSSYRGQIALQDWNLKLSSAGSETPLYKSINDMDYVKTVLIWHMATNMLYFQDNNTNYCQEMSNELSNYIMYLVFKCGVMLTNSSELQHANALEAMKKRGLGEMDNLNKVFQASQLQTGTSESSIHPLFSHACEVAHELMMINIPREATRWDLITAVWLEMLFYIAPRCGGAFHYAHLATGGEFISHVLFLMQLLGPFLKPPGI